MMAVVTVQVPVTPPSQGLPPSTPKPKLEWRIHPHTGVAFQVEISPQYPPASQQMTAQPTYAAATHFPSPSQQVPVHPNQAVGPAQQQGEKHIMSQSEILGNVSEQHSANISSLSKNDRLAGIVSLLEGGGSPRNNPR